MRFAHRQVDRVVLKISLRKTRVISQSGEVARKIRVLLAVTDAAKHLVPLIKNLVNADVKVIGVVRLGAVFGEVIESSRLVGRRVQVQQLVAVAVNPVTGSTTPALTGRVVAGSNIVAAKNDRPKSSCLLPPIKVRRSR